LFRAFTAGTFNPRVASVSGPMPLFGIDSQSAHTRLDAADPANDPSVALPFLLKFSFQRREIYPCQTTLSWRSPD